MTAHLVVPSTDLQASYLAGIAELVEEGYLAGKLDVATLARDFDAYVAAVVAHADGEALPEGHSPETERWLVDDDGYVGTVKVRHRLGNAHLATVGGHVGYYVRPSRRGEGHGHRCLALALEVAAGIGLDRVLVTCREGNAASRAVIEGLGGVPDGVGSAGDDRYLRYWFDLA